MRVTDLIVQDHKQVHDLFLELERTAGAGARRELLDQLVEELSVHAQAEEEVVYPALRDVSRRIDDAHDAHEHIRALIAEVQDVDASSAEFSTSVRDLRQSVLNHAAEEEGGILLEAGRLGGERLEELAGRMQERKDTLRTLRTERGARGMKQAERKIA
jgi:hemerythrin superfamily protein